MPAGGGGAGGGAAWEVSSLKTKFFRLFIWILQVMPHNVLHGDVGRHVTARDWGAKWSMNGIIRKNENHDCLENPNTKRSPAEWGSSSRVRGGETPSNTGGGWARAVCVCVCAYKALNTKEVLHNSMLFIRSIYITTLTSELQNNIASF